MMNTKKEEIKRLYNMGFAIHALRPSSKIPVKSGWSSDNREILSALLKEFKPENNIGTKLGKPSHISTPFGDEGFLAVIDVDVKGQGIKYQNAAKAKVNEMFPGLLDSAPITLSGRGNGSMHIWVLVDSPIESCALFASNDLIEVHMPSAKPTDKQIEILGAEKVKKGMRLRPAFEIDFMCNGRQVVLPPSTHPDTGKKYKWLKEITDTLDIPFLDIKESLKHIQIQKKSHAGRPSGGSVEMIKPVDVDELELELRLKPDVVDNIMEGSEVNDRSAACLSIALHMLRAEFTEAEIIGVLTNRKFFIGDVAFEHAKTTNRMRAARWVERYCLAKAKDEMTSDFDCEMEVYDTLSDDRAAKQSQRLVDKKKAKVNKDDGFSWKIDLDRTDKDKLKPTLKNLVLILENDIAPNVFKRDLFTNSDSYGVATPWGAKVGDILTDDDCVKIKIWFSEKWKIEPSVNIVLEAMIIIAIENAYHPVKNYLESLTWDGVPRVETWCKTYLGAEAAEPYLSDVSRKFMIAAVARVYEPGIKFDNMLIFEGLQGIGKSTVGSILASPNWFLDGIPDLHDKDSALNLQGNWIVEMGELSNLKRSDVETVKGFITRQIDKVRPPYGKRYISSKRQCVFFGTTNAEDYLKDKTGNRRFWPVKVADVDIEGLREDRDQLWAEALYLYDVVGEKLWLDDDEAKEQAEQEQGLRVSEDTSDVIFDALVNWTKKIKQARKDRIGINGGKKLKAFKFKTKELFDDFTQIGEDGVDSGSPLKDFKVDNYNLQLASNALRKIGFKKIAIHGYRQWKME